MTNATQDVDKPERDRPARIKVTEEAVNAATDVLEESGWIEDPFPKAISITIREMLVAAFAAAGLVEKR